MANVKHCLLQMTTMEHTQPSSTSDRVVKPKASKATFTNINATGYSSYHIQHPVPPIPDGVSSRYPGYYHHVATSDRELIHLNPTFTSNYHVLDELGIGGTSFVRLVRHVETSREVAVSTLGMAGWGTVGWFK